MAAGYPFLKGALRTLTGNRSAGTDALVSAATVASLVLRENVVALTVLWLLNLPKPKRVTVPMLVLGADQDHASSLKEVRATARAYRTEAEIFPNMAHNMMLEPGWDKVAERIDGWLRQLPFEAPRSPE